MRPRVPLLHHSTCCSRRKPTPPTLLLHFSPSIFEFKLTAQGHYISRCHQMHPLPLPSPPRARNTLSLPMTSRQALTRRRCQNTERPLSDALQATYEPSEYRLLRSHFTRRRTASRASAWDTWLPYTTRCLYAARTRPLLHMADARLFPHSQVLTDSTWLQNIFFT